MARRVYFAFHYKDVEEFRANVVRNHHVVEGTEKAGYFDASIWEEAKRTSPLALKRLINSELENTTATAVLIGTDTYARRWVRYEIFRSMFRGNKLIGIQINSIKGKDGLTKALGPNPFEYLALQYNANGTAVTPKEWNGSGWVDSPDMESYNLTQQSGSHNWGKLVQLSTWYPVYDWVANDGYNNFDKWIK
jgi:hypothetical protein